MAFALVQRNLGLKTCRPQASLPVSSLRVHLSQTRASMKSQSRKFQLSHSCLAATGKDHGESLSRESNAAQHSGQGKEGRKGRAGPPPAQPEGLRGALHSGPASALQCPSNSRGGTLLTFLDSLHQSYTSAFLGSRSHQTASSESSSAPQQRPTFSKQPPGGGPGNSGSGDENIQTKSPILGEYYSEINSVF